MEIIDYLYFVTEHPVDFHINLMWLCWISLSSDLGSEKLKFAYLHHQWSDGADTLQFDSTGEHFETVEYELKRCTELRDIE